MKNKKQVNLEEALCILWKFKESQEKDQKKIEDTLNEEVCQEVCKDLLDNNFIIAASGEISLTEEGERIARDITRRHRLAERLLADVVEIPKGEIDKTACEFEHIISADVADAICTLLGHPQVCPHGSHIPPGPCCKRAEAKIESIVFPLTNLEASEKAKVAYIVTSEHPHLHKLLSLGIVPGTEIRLHQKSPSYVIKVGETQIALDKDVANQIYVRRI